MAGQGPRLVKLAGECVLRHTMYLFVLSHSHPLRFNSQINAQTMRVCLIEKACTSYVHGCIRCSMWLVIWLLHYMRDHVIHYGVAFNIAYGQRADQTQVII